MGIIKTLLFHLLLSLRQPILRLCTLLSLAFMGCLLMALCLPELQQVPVDT